MASNKSLNEINDIDTISERVDLAISEKNWRATVLFVHA